MIPLKYDHRFELQQATPSMRLYRADGVSARLDFFSHMLRVAIIHEGEPVLPTWSVCPGEADCPREGRDKLSTAGFECQSPNVEEDGETLRFSLDGVSFVVEKKNFRITAEENGTPLYADREGLAYNFEGELGDGAIHYTRRFEGQRIFGLGDKGGTVNKAGRSFAIAATDSMGFHAAFSDPLYKQIPFYICEHDGLSYGVFYDTLSNGKMDFGVEHDNYFEPFSSARFEEKNLVFYLILGSTARIVRRFSWLCGEIAPVPDWAFRYCGSTMEYTDAPDADARLRRFAHRCREEGIRAGGFYLSSGYTQIGERRCVFHWNTDKIPSPEALAAYFRAEGMELIANVKPAFLTEHPLYETIASQGWFLHYADGSPARFPFWGGMASYLDFTNPGAYEFWKGCVRTQLAEKGYESIWNDNNEYDVPDADVWACGFGHPFRARLARPLQSYLMARASREAVIELMGGDYVPFNVSRCAMAGTQRVATTWTGDNLTAFDELRYNHRQAMTMALTGFVFFGPDIGGFSGPQPDEELFLRWLQLGVFQPRFVLHSWKPGEKSTMPWLYPAKMDAVRRIFALRERMLGYLAAEEERARTRHEPLIYPVFLRQSDYDCEADAFFCGDHLLACPVLDRGAEAVTLTLPDCVSRWYLRGGGEPLEGGSCLTVPCRAEDEPVWFSDEPGLL